MDKTDNLYFPLCCLNFSKDIKKTADLVMSYSIVEFAEKLETTIELESSDYDKIEKYIERNNLDDITDEEDNFIILAAKKLGINFSSLTGIKNQHREINNYVSDFENKHGTDAKVKVHKDLLFEVRDGKFDERLFRIYCAVISIIGNKKFVRITNQRISYRMLGFKSLEVSKKEKSKYKVMTARQIKTTSDKLCEKNLFAKLTYRNRMTFYSREYKGKAFQEVLISSIALNKEKKIVNQILNEQLNTGVENKRKEIKEKLISGLTVKEIKCEMELVKTG